MPRQKNKNNKKNNNKSRRFYRVKNKFPGMTPLKVGRTNNTIMPDELLTTLVYTSVAQLNPGTVTYEYVFSGNGLFDPDITLLGTQPVGFDQMENFYSRYRVISSKIVVRFINTANGGTIVAVTPSDTSTGTTAANDAIANPYSRWNVIANANGMNEKTIVNACRTDHIFGTVANSDDLFAASFSTNPTNQWYWIINMDSTINLLIMMNVAIYYRVKFYKRVPLNLSVPRLPTINLITSKTIKKKQIEYKEDEADVNGNYDITILEEELPVGT